LHLLAFSINPDLGYKDKRGKYLYIEKQPKIASLASLASHPLYNKGLSSDANSDATKKIASSFSTAQPISDAGDASDDVSDANQNLASPQTDKYANLMSLMSSCHKPKQDKDFSDDINNDINDISQNLMSSPPQDSKSNDINNDINDISQNLMSSPEASPSKGYDINDINDIKNGYLSVRGADGQLSLLPDELVNKKIPNHYQLEDGDQDEF